jgi:hypothetical protein
LERFAVLFPLDIRRLFSNFTVNKVKNSREEWLYLHSRGKQTNLSETIEANPSDIPISGIVILLILFVDEVEYSIQSLFELFVVALELRQVFYELWNQLDALLANLQRFALIDEFQDFVDDFLLILHDDVFGSLRGGAAMAFDLDQF